MEILLWAIGQMAYYNDARVILAQRPQNVVKLAKLENL